MSVSVSVSACLCLFVFVGRGAGVGRGWGSPLRREGSPAAASKQAKVEDAVQAEETLWISVREAMRMNALKLYVGKAG